MCYSFYFRYNSGGSIAIGKLFHYFFGMNQTLAMLLELGIVTLYSTLGGIKAVAITDVFQFLIFYIALPWNWKYSLLK